MKLPALNLQLYLKKTAAKMFSRAFCDIFKNNYFVEHLQMPASGTKKRKKKYLEEWANSKYFGRLFKGSAISSISDRRSFISI